MHGLPDVGTTPVSAIMSPAEFCEPDEPLRAAAARLGRDGVSALLVRLDDGGLGILTDADVRAAVAVGGVSLDAPARAAARAPVPTVPPTQLAIEATVDMLAAGVEHVAVLDGDRICGVLSAADLLGLDARSPIALRHTILGGADEDALVRAAGASAASCSCCSSRAGRAPPRPRPGAQPPARRRRRPADRLLDLAARPGAGPVGLARPRQRGPAGVHARLRPGQRARLRDRSSTGLASEVDAYFARLGADVNDGLVRCGIGVDNNGVLAGNRQWRMSKADWLRTFDECLNEPDESHLIRATVAFDFRPTAGGLAVAAELTARIRAAREHPQFMRLMARTATGYPVALGLPRPARHRTRGRSAREARPQARRDHPARQPGPLPRAGAAA